MMRKFIYLFIATCFLVFVIYSWPEWWGDYSLGNNYHLLEGDNKDRVIVYCTGKNWGACHAGIAVVPSTKDTSTLYVENANEDNDWILAKTKNKDKSESYWIIYKNFKVDLNNCIKNNCDSIIQSHVTGPLTFHSFKSKLKELHIELNL